MDNQLDQFLKILFLRLLKHRRVPTELELAQDTGLTITDIQNIESKYNVLTQMDELSHQAFTLLVNKLYNQYRMIKSIEDFKHIMTEVELQAASNTHRWDR